ncbi:MAG: hypothetical protein ABFD50_14115 [Smithella sp.]
MKQMALNYSIFNTEAARRGLTSSPTGIIYNLPELTKRLLSLSKHEPVLGHELYLQRLALSLSKGSTCLE